MGSSPVIFFQVGMSRSYLIREEPIKTVALLIGSYTSLRFSLHRLPPSSYEIPRPCCRRYTSHAATLRDTNTTASIPAFKKKRFCFILHVFFNSITNDFFVHTVRK